MADQWQLLIIEAGGSTRRFIRSPTKITEAFFGDVEGNGVAKSSLCVSEVLSDGTKKATITVCELEQGIVSVF